MTRDTYGFGFTYVTDDERLDRCAIGEFWQGDYDAVAPALPYVLQPDIAAHIAINQPLQEAHIK